MSEFHIISSSAPPPPQVPTQFVTDDGTAIPVLNILNVNGIDSTENDLDLDGVLTRATPNLGNNLLIVLTNRITGTATSTDGVTPVTIYTFPMGGTPGTYTFFTKIAAYNITDGTSSGYVSQRIVRTTGAAGVLISANTSLIGEEGTMENIDLTNTIVGNNALLNVVGLAGKTINYVALTEYVFSS